MKSISIIIPVYNERATFETLLKRVLNADVCGLKKEIVVIDDCSTDGTRELLKKLPQQDNLKIFFQEYNCGKGAALRTGFKKASGDILLIQDADLEYNPDEYPILLAPLLANKADVVYGSRFLGGPRRVLFFWHYAGNKLLTLLSNIACNLNLSDMETCYKVFKREVLQTITLQSNRFGFEPEFTVKVARKGFRFYEVPISYDGRSYDEGKKITWKDGIVALFIILKARFWVDLVTDKSN